MFALELERILGVLGAMRVLAALLAGRGRCCSVLQQTSGELETGR
jgi:hypothetical protein